MCVSSAPRPCGPTARSYGGRARLSLPDLAVAPVVGAPLLHALTSPSDEGSAAARVVADRAHTPGALNPDVTQATIGSTICVRGWTRTIRPPSSYTSALKVEQLAEYGLEG